jgi:adenylylsulfate reductase subunit B
MPPIIDPLLCNGCKKCIELCPEDILSFSEELGIAIVSYPDECWHCGVCMIDCPLKAISRFEIPSQMRVSIVKKE